MKLEGFCDDHNMYIASNLDLKSLTVLFQCIFFRRGRKWLCLCKRDTASMGKQGSKSPVRVFRRMDGNVVLNAKSLLRENLNR